MSKSEWMSVQGLVFSPTQFLTWMDQQSSKFFDLRFYSYVPPRKDKNSQCYHSSTSKEAKTQRRKADAGKE